MFPFILGGLSGGGQGGLGQVVSYFEMRSSMTDVSTAIGITNVLMSAAILVVSVLGFVALAIWVSRIGVDILLITLRGTAIADKLRNLGTNKDASSYDKVSNYLKTNLVEIILVVVLVALMVTGWLWKIFAMALQGVGGILNFLLGLDFNGMLSSTDYDAWKENVTRQRPAAIRNEYDKYLTAAINNLDQLYNMTDVDNNNPVKQNIVRQYALNLARAQHISTEKGGELTTALKLDGEYFNRHKKVNACNTAFLGQGPGQDMLDQISVRGISCES